MKQAVFFMLVSAVLLGGCDLLSGGSDNEQRAAVKDFDGYWVCPDSGVLLNVVDGKMVLSSIEWDDKTNLVFEFKQREPNIFDVKAVEDDLETEFVTDTGRTSIQLHDIEQFESLDCKRAPRIERRELIGTWHASPKEVEDGKGANFKTVTRYKDGNLFDLYTLTINHGKRAYATSEMRDQRYRVKNGFILEDLDENGDRLIAFYITQIDKNRFEMIDEFGGTVVMNKMPFTGDFDTPEGYREISAEYLNN